MTSMPSEVEAFEGGTIPPTVGKPFTEAPTTNKIPNTNPNIKPNNNPEAAPEVENQDMTKEEMEAAVQEIWDNYEPYPKDIFSAALLFTDVPTDCSRRVSHPLGDRHIQSTRKSNRRWIEIRCHRIS